MSDVQRHIHYERTPFTRKLFYIGMGAALYWFMFSDGCSKAKSLCSNAMDNAPEQIQRIYNACDNLAGYKTIDAKVR